MFTGIIEETGEVLRTDFSGEWGKIQIRASKVLEGTKIGDSIAVNGVCLTVTNLKAEGFQADVMAETFRKSNLGKLKSADRVNLERAMAADGRFGGHIVSGHIDGVGTICETKKEGNAVWITIKAPEEIIRGVVTKGSICIDGISLTVAEVTEDRFKVSVIPHTGKETTLLDKNTGSIVNLENDIVGKYIQRFMSTQEKSPESNRNPLTMEFLEKYGF